MATIIANAFTLVAVDTERTIASPVLVGLDMPDTVFTTGTLVVVRVSTLPSTTAVVCVSAGKRHEHVNRTVDKRGCACAASAAASVQSAAAAMASAPARGSCPTTDSMAARSRPFTATLTPLRPRARHPAEPNPRSRRCHRDARHGRFPVRRRALPPRHPKVVRRPPPTSRLRRRPGNDRGVGGCRSAHPPTVADPTSRCRPTR
jgi:hypothetical protein